MFNPQSESWLKNKYDFYNKMPPVWFCEEYNMYILTKYDDVKFALKTPEIFSSSLGNLIVESPHRFNQTLGASDNPTHDTLKNSVIEAYSRHQLERILFDFPFSFDIYKDASRFTARILGLPYDEEYVVGIIKGIQEFSRRNVLNNTNEYYYNEFIRLCSMGKKPKSTGIYSFFCKNNYLSLMTGPTLSGTISTIGAIQMMIFDLANHPEQYKRIVDNPDLVPNAVNELIRYSTSTGRFSRTTIKDIELQGEFIKKGSRVALCLDAANRDTSVFEKASKLNIDRDTSPSLGFGYGIHSCIALLITKSFMIRYLENLIRIYPSGLIVSKDPRFTITASGNFDVFENETFKIIGEDANGKHRSYRVWETNSTG